MRYSIPECNIENLEKKIVRIRNKCAKYGCEFKYERVGEHFEQKTFYESDNGGVGEFDRGDRTVREWKEIVKYIDVECEGVAKINGWKFAASLEYTDKGNLIDAVPGIEIPKKFYDCEPWCEHCKTRRDRKKSYVVLNEETGEFKQVGRGCLADFTGGLSAEWAAQVESFFKEFEEAREYVGGSGRTFINVREFMVYCAEAVRTFGYVKNDGIGVSTVDRALSCYLVDCGRRYAKYQFDIYNESVGRGFDPKRQESIDLADVVVKWAVENCNDSNYFHNLRIVCSEEYCDRGRIGLLASAFPSHNRELEIEAEKRERELKAKLEAKKSKHVGEVGKRVSFVPVDVVCVTSWETMYGMTSIYKMEDEDGNVFVWKTGSFLGEYQDGKKTMVVGKVTGTVKEHKEYRGVKQTELTRCRVEYVEKKVAPPKVDEAEVLKNQEGLEKALEMAMEGF